MRRALIAAVALFALSGCSGVQPAPSSPGSSDAPQPLEVALTMDVVVQADGTVTVSAESNLPDGTELGASVFAVGTFSAQDPAVLRSGVAEFGPFSDKGAALPPGEYDVSVTMPIARNQPDAVKAILGEHGENLTGPLVSAESITGDAVVEVSEKLVVP